MVGLRYFRVYTYTKHVELYDVVLWSSMLSVPQNESCYLAIWVLMMTANLFCFEYTLYTIIFVIGFEKWCFVKHTVSAQESVMW